MGLAGKLKLCQFPQDSISVVLEQKKRRGRRANPAAALIYQPNIEAIPDSDDEAERTTPQSKPTKKRTRVQEATEEPTHASKKPKNAIPKPKPSTSNPKTVIPKQKQPATKPSAPVVSKSGKKDQPTSTTSRVLRSSKKIKPFSAYFSLIITHNFFSNRCLN